MNVVGPDCLFNESQHALNQVRQRLEQIRRLNSQVDELMAEGGKFKENMDILGSRKEVVQAQLKSAEAQLRAAKENASVLIERAKELQSRLDLATSDKASLANELEVVRSEVTEANKRANAKVAQFRIGVEVNQAKAKSMVKHAKWQARREALEEVSAQGFDVEAEIENAKAEENRARRLAFTEEDSDRSSESEDEEDPEDTVSNEDQAI
ncbi:probable kinetochore protein nuf2 [Nicotiana tomentosiformis]|uniref:probable kinetochore protein nuf2 n=1 Tax=Nicotiana tomentosiformis TaxID=4098 RepID=UPI00388C3F86